MANCTLGYDTNHRDNVVDKIAWIIYDLDLKCKHWNLRQLKS